MSEEEGSDTRSVLGKRSRDSDDAKQKVPRFVPKLIVNDIIFMVHESFWYPAQVVEIIDADQVKLQLMGHIPTKYVITSANLEDIKHTSSSFNMSPKLTVYSQWNAEQVRQREAKRRLGQWELTQRGEDIYYALVSNIVKKHIDTSEVLNQPTFRIRLQTEALSQQLLDQVRHRVNKDINFVGYNLQYWGPHEEDGFTSFKLVEVPLDDNVLRDWM